MPHIEIAQDQIPLEQPIRLEQDGTAIVVVRTEETIAAFPDICPHAHWRLSDGEVIDGLLECPGHCWEFDIATGHCVTVPAYPLKCLSVVNEDGKVRIELDEASEK